MTIHRAALRGGGVAAFAAAIVAATPTYAQDVEDSDDIIVTAQRDNQSQVTRRGSLGALGEKDAMDTPFAIKSYNSALILNQQPQTLGQVLENDPAIRTTNGFGIAGELFVMRGFPLFSDDIGLNGLYGLTPRQLVAPELYEQVQVLNGASAFLNGAAPGGSGLGGAINLISKRAGDRPLTRVTANYAGTSHFGGAFDVGRRLDDGRVGVRINGALRRGDVAVDDEFRSATVLGGSFDWTSDRFSLNVDLGYQRQHVRGLRHKVALAAGATAIPRVPGSNVNYAQQWQYAKQEDIFGTVSARYQLADNAEFYASFGARDGSEDSVAINAVLITNPDGTATGSNAQYTPRSDNNEAAQAGLRVRGNGAGISHELNMGGSINWQVSRAAYQRYATYVTNIYNPVEVARPAENTVRGGNLTDPYPVTRIRLYSFFVSDTLGFFDDAALLTIGLRRQTIEDTRYAYVATGAIPLGGQTSRYSESAVTPVVGLVIKPTENISLYANRIEGLVQGASAPAGTANFGEVFAPYKTAQYEVGGKVVLGGINASLAAFQTEQPNAFTVDNVFGLNGLQRNKGIEFSIDGELTDGLRMIGGAALNDAKLVDTLGGVNEGNKVPGVPDYTVNANIEWDLGIVPLTLTGRVMHTGPQMVNQSNTLELDSWTRIDLGARFVTAFGDSPLTFRLNVDNVFNKRYWASAFTTFPAFDASLLQGLPRTLKLSVTADF